MAGRGVALRTTVDEASAALASIEVDDQVDRPGTGPVAFGALPFVPDPSAPMVVPSVVWGRDDDGTQWVTTITGADDDLPLEQPSSGHASPAAGSVRVTPTRPADWWCELVDDATKAIAEAGPEGLRKVVLAREVVVEADQPFDTNLVLQRLRHGYPGCFLFHVDGFLGASPELLVQRHGDVVRAQPMAGTASRGGNPTTDAALADALLASPTYRHEHQITIDMVFDTLLPWCSYLDYEPEPSVVTMANVQHLATLVEGRLSHPSPTILDLVGALHPTPAVNGWPAEDATRWIVEHEGFDRGRYAGTVGWVDGRGNGTFAVSIRCADIDGRRARLVAGNGIVVDSQPFTELAETQNKLQALLSVLVRV
jgi:menaquinone-specific isochorismate synthase